MRRIVYKAIKLFAVTMMDNSEMFVNFLRRRILASKFQLSLQSTRTYTRADQDGGGGGVTRTAGRAGLITTLPCVQVSLRYRCIQ